MKKYIVICMLAMSLAACSKSRTNGMKPQLDSIRVMIKQSALMAVEAACVDADNRDALIHAAAVMNRRAMGGEEMAKIHKTMNMQPDAGGQMSMPMKPDESMSAEMRQHVALHDAGEAVFDLLDGMAGSSAIHCTDIAPVAMTAAAAALRDAGGRESMENASSLDRHVANMLKDKSVPASARTLALALQRI